MLKDKEREYRARILAALSEGVVHAGLWKNGLLKRWQEEGTSIPVKEFHALVWKLICEGLVFPLPDFNNESGLSDFQLKLTEQGRRYMETEGDFEPDDPEGFLDLLDQRVPDLAPLVRKYFQEALFAYRADCFLASAVMLGCASEKAILLLGETYLANPSTGSSEKFEKDFCNPKIGFARKLQALRDRIRSCASSLPLEFKRDAMTALNGTADFIRQTRNEAGHPSGVELSRDNVRTNSKVALHYIQIIHALSDYFRKAARSLAAPDDLDA